MHSIQNEDLTTLGLLDFDKHITPMAIVSRKEAILLALLTMWWQPKEKRCCCGERSPR